MATDLSADIASQAVEPVSVSSDGQSATRAPIQDLITADQYVAAKAARRSRRGGIQFMKFINAGAAADGGGVCGGAAPFGGGIG